MLAEQVFDDTLIGENGCDIWNWIDLRDFRDGSAQATAIHHQHRFPLDAGGQFGFRRPTAAKHAVEQVAHGATASDSAGTKR